MKTTVTTLKTTSGNNAENQFEIKIGDIRIFQSYNAIIAKIENGKTTLDEEFWNYSRTTAKYRTIFLGENRIETQKKIDSGEYKLENLN